MWSLVTSRGQRVPLRRLPAVLGSDAQAADVVLPHPSIAPRHARVAEGADGRLHLEALDGAPLETGGSTVASADMAHGDELVLGRVRLTLADDRAAASAPTAAPSGGAAADDDGELVLRERRDGGSSAVAAPGGRATRRTDAGATAGGPGRAAGRSRGETGPARERGVLVVDHGQRRRGLLHADLSQLGGPGKALVVLAVVVLAAAVLWGVQAAVAAFG